MENETTRRIDRLTCAFEAHGYFVGAEPIPGSEALFADALAEGFAKVETALAFNARRFGFRGLSKRAVAALHSDLPAPTWGVEVATV